MLHVNIESKILTIFNLLDCPYGHLTEGHVSDRLQNTSDRLTVLDYLVTELMGARILQDNKPERKLELKLVCFKYYHV